MAKAIKILVFGLSILLGANWSLSGQEVELTANAKTNVQVGEQFRIIYTVNDQASDFKGPTFDGFRLLSGPNQSTNQSYQIINGKVSQSFQLTYTYYVKAMKEGSFEIQPASVVVKGKTYKSIPLKITVSEAPAGSPASAQDPSQARPARQEGDGISKDDVFIRAYADKTNPVQGEQVTITYKIYTVVPISQISITKQSTFPGFWNKNLLNDNEPLRQYNETINGKQYTVADLRKIAIFPQRSGQVTIEPMEMECLAQVRTERSRQARDPFFDSFFDDPFFNRNFQNVQLRMESNPVNLNIRSLPLENRPLGFSGAVGEFTLDSEIDRTELKANEPMIIKIRIRGKGNIDLIEPPALTFPPDFETYDPKVSADLNTGSLVISGTKTFEYLVIPRNAGQFEIKPFEFIYFSTEKKQYVRLVTPAYKINVSKSEEESAGITYSGVSQKDIQFIGSDVRHIKTHSFKLARAGHYFFGSVPYLLWFIIPLFLSAIILVAALQNRKRKGNIELMKNRRANKVARKNLKKASEYLKQDLGEEFYEEISKAIWGYISFKFNIPLSELSVENVRQRLVVKKIGSETIDTLIEVLNKCEYARFAPGDKSRIMQDIYSDAMGIITRIENELK